MRALTLLFLLLLWLQTPCAAQGVGWDGFPVLVWRHRHAGEALPAELVAPFGGVNVEGDQTAEWVLAEGLDFYVGHAPGRNDLHLDSDGEAWRPRFEEWIESRDADLLVREPCLSEPGTRARLFAILDQSLAARDGATGLFVSLGDEVGLTPNGNPADVCRSKACEAAWRAWCAERGLGELEAPLTDDLLIAHARGETERLPAWLARRAFHGDVVHELLAELAARTRAASPEAPVALLGVSGTTPFGGVDLARVLPFLDVVEPYEQGGARELVFALRTEKQRVLRTVFLHDDEPAGVAWQAWEHWVRGGDGLVVWSDALLADHPDRRAALAGAVGRIRALEEQLGGARPRPAGMAVVVDFESEAVGWVRDALADGATWPRRHTSWHETFGTAPRSRWTWLRLFQDLGYQPALLPLERVGADSRERYPLLVLPHLLSLNEAKVARIDAHLAAGGSIVVDGEAGTFDGVERREEGALLARWRAAAPGRVHAPPEDLRSYAARRVRSEEHARVPLQREEAQRLAEGAGVGPPPLQIANRPDPLPWLVAERALANGRVALAAIPSVSMPAHRKAYLRDLDVRAEIPPGWTPEVLHPPGAEWTHEANRSEVAASLPAGEALVLVLTPGGD